MIEQLRGLYAHLFWADARAVEAVRGAKDLPPKALVLLSHVLGAEEVWLSRLERRPAEAPVWPDLTVDACAELAAENRRKLEVHLAGLGAGDLERIVAYTNSAGQSFESKISDILLHVALHGCYHRGQVMLLLREAGSEPAATDYIAFVRGAPAATRQG